ncbi:hypothetical protein L1047_02080 [Synechococcus sp. Nb3U1]|uniref:hypothetical protein n=1 Tax=Synechococcus sp. Nb3U1 TaxID=1914529 RepID=UPI001F1AFA68|nr:hypothetical protein [Synechococcus sp. Nb3U1]MCF2969983.1 hypothetical protein [Synechococcus sp. Nb3U1]
MSILKKLFGGLFSFFGILFGGLWDFVTGPFRSAPDPAQVSSTPIQSATAEVMDAAAPSPVTVATTAPVSKPKVVVEKPFVPNEISAPRPNRRPGPALDIFRSMAQEIPSVRA